VLVCSVPVPSSTGSFQSPDRMRRRMEDWTRVGGYKGTQTASSKTLEEWSDNTHQSEVYLCVRVFTHVPSQNTVISSRNQRTCPGFAENLPFRGIRTPNQEQRWLLKAHTCESALEPNEKQNEKIAYSLFILLVLSAKNTEKILIYRTVQKFGVSKFF